MSMRSNSIGILLILEMKNWHIHGILTLYRRSAVNLQNRLYAYNLNAAIALSKPHMAQSRHMRHLFSFISDRKQHLFCVEAINSKHDLRLYLTPFIYIKFPHTTFTVSKNRAILGNICSSPMLCVYV